MTCSPSLANIQQLIGNCFSSDPNVQRENLEKMNFWCSDPNFADVLLQILQNQNLPPESRHMAGLILKQVFVTHPQIGHPLMFRLSQLLPISDGHIRVVVCTCISVSLVGLATELWIPFLQAVQSSLTGENAHQWQVMAPAIAMLTQIIVEDFSEKIFEDEFHAARELLFSLLLQLFNQSNGRLASITDRVIPFQVIGIVIRSLSTIFKVGVVDEAEEVFGDNIYEELPEEEEDQDIIVTSKLSVSCFNQLREFASATIGLVVGHLQNLSVEQGEIAAVIFEAVDAILGLEWKCASSYIPQLLDAIQWVCSHHQGVGEQCVAKAAALCAAIVSKTPCELTSQTVDLFLLSSVDMLQLSDFDLQQCSQGNDMNIPDSTSETIMLHSVYRTGETDGADDPNSGLLNSTDQLSVSRHALVWWLNCVAVNFSSKITNDFLPHLGSILSEALRDQNPSLHICRKIEAALLALSEIIDEVVIHLSENHVQSIVVTLSQAFGHSSGLVRKGVIRCIQHLLIGYYAHQELISYTFSVAPLMQILRSACKDVNKECQWYALQSLFSVLLQMAGCLATDEDEEEEDGICSNIGVDEILVEIMNNLQFYQMKSKCHIFKLIKCCARCEDACGILHRCHSSIIPPLLNRWSCIPTSSFESCAIVDSICECVSVMKEAWLPYTEFTFSACVQILNEYATTNCSEILSVVTIDLLGLLISGNPTLSVKMPPDVLHFIITLALSKDRPKEIRRTSFGFLGDFIEALPNDAFFLTNGEVAPLFASLPANCVQCLTQFEESLLDLYGNVLWCFCQTLRKIKQSIEIALAPNGIPPLLQMLSLFLCCRDLNSCIEFKLNTLIVLCNLAGLFPEYFSEVANAVFPDIAYYLLKISDMKERHEALQSIAASCRSPKLTEKLDQAALVSLLRCSLTLKTKKCSHELVATWSAIIQQLINSLPAKNNIITLRNQVKKKFGIEN